MLSCASGTQPPALGLSGGRNGQLLPHPRGDAPSSAGYCQLTVLPGPVGGVLGAEALRVERTEAPPRPSPSSSHSLPKGGATHLQQRLRTSHGVGGRRERELVSNGPPPTSQALSGPEIAALPWAAQGWPSGR